MVTWRPAFRNIMRKTIFFSWDLIFDFCHFLQFLGQKSMFVPPIFFFTKNVFKNEADIIPKRMIYHTYVLHLCKCSGDEARKGVFLYLRSNFGEKMFAVDCPQGELKIISSKPHLKFSYSSFRNV